MKESEDDIENVFRERFSEDEAPVSPRVWNAVKQSLPPEKTRFWGAAKNIFSTGIKKNLIWVSLGTMLTGVAVVWQLNKTSEPTEQALLDKELIGKKDQNTSNKSLTKNEQSENIALKENRTINKNLSTTENDASQGSDNMSTANTVSNENSSTTLQNSRNDKKEKGKREVAVSENFSKNKTIGFTKKNNRKDVKGTISINDRKTGKKNQQTKNVDRTEANKDRKREEKGLTNNKPEGKNQSKKTTGLSERTNGRDVNGLVSVSDPTTETNKVLTDPNKALQTKTNQLKETGKDESSFVNKDTKNSDNTTTSVVSSDGQLMLTSRQNKNKEENTNGVQHKTEANPNGAILTKDQSTGNDLASPNSDASLKTHEPEHTTFSDPAVANDNKQDHPAPDLLSHRQENGKAMKEDSATVTILPDPLAQKNTPVLRADSLQAKLDTLQQEKRDSTAMATADTAGAKTETKQLPVKITRWSVDLLVDPMLTGASTRASDPTLQSTVNSKNKQDKNQLNFSAGAMVNYSLNPRVYVSTGVFYSSYTEKYNFKNTISRDSMTYGSHEESYLIPKNDSLGNHIGDSTAYYTVPDSTNVSLGKEYSSRKKDHYSFLSFPVSVSYYVVKKDRFAVCATAGLRMNLLMKSTTYLVNPEGTDLVQYNSGISKVTLSYMAALALEYRLKKTIYLLAQPVVNYHANSIYTKSSSLSQKPYSVGMNIGLRIKF